MQTGTAKIKRLVLKNFGKENICRIVEVQEDANFTTDEFVFEAIRAFLDKDYRNEEVTKPRYPGTDSYAVLVMNIDGSEFRIKRVFGQKHSTRVESKDTVEHYNKHFPCKLPRETYTTKLANTAPGLIMEHLFSRQVKTADELEKLNVQVDTFTRGVLQIFTRQEKDQLEAAVKQDLAVREEIQKLNWKWLMSKENSTSNLQCCEEILKLTPTRPLDPIDFRIILVTTYLYSFHRSVTVHQEKKLRRTMDTLLNEYQVYPLHGIIFFSSTWEELQIASLITQYSQGFASDQRTFYEADSNLIPMYKSFFSTANAWEKEKEIIRQKRIEEQQFSVHLAKQIPIINTKIEKVRRDTVNSLNRIQTLTLSLDDLDFADLITTFSDFQSNIWETIRDILHEFYEALCEFLNNPTLDVACIKNYIAGLFHIIVKHPGTDTFKFLFDHVASSNEPLFNMLQTYLAPLSRIIYFTTIEEAISGLNDVMADESNVEKQFMFAAVETIEVQNQKAKSAGVKSARLSNIPKHFGYDLPALRNLLSHLKITHDSKHYDGDVNLLNVSTEQISFVNKEKSFAAASNDLFHLLRTIKAMYTKIGHALSQFNESADNFIKHTEELVTKLNEHYHIESQLRSEFLNLQLLSFESLNLDRLLREVFRLTDENQSRLNIYDKLLLVQYDDIVDYNRCVEVLSQLNKNVSEISVVVGAENVTTDKLPNVRGYRNNVQKMYDYVGRLRYQQENIRNALEAVHLKWKLASVVAVNPNYAIREKLSTISGIDYMGIVYYCKKYIRRKAIPQDFKIDNALSYKEIFTEIDKHKSTLQFPDASVSDLEKLYVYFESFEELQKVVDNIGTMVKQIAASYDQSSNAALTTLCNKLTDAVVDIKEKANYSVHCEIGPEKYLTASKLVRFYVKNGQETVKGLDDLIAMLLYVYYVQHFTIQPILLNELEERFDVETVIAVYNLLKNNVPGRSSIIRISQELQIEKSLKVLDASEPCEPNAFDKYKRRSKPMRGGKTTKSRGNAKTPSSRRRPHHTSDIIADESLTVPNEDIDMDQH